MQEKYVELTCHCQSVKIHLHLPNGFEKLRRCNCSLCSRKGAIVASVKLNNLQIIKGSEVLSLYQFHTHTAKHYFCSICGIYTHHQRRSDSTEYGFNVGCVEQFNINDYSDILTLDGINHPSDQNL